MSPKQAYACQVDEDDLEFPILPLLPFNYCTEVGGMWPHTQPEIRSFYGNYSKKKNMTKSELNVKDCGVVRDTAWECISTWTG